MRFTILAAGLISIAAAAPAPSPDWIPPPSYRAIFQRRDTEVKRQGDPIYRPATLKIITRDGEEKRQSDLYRPGELRIVTRDGEEKRQPDLYRPGELRIVTRDDEEKRAPKDSNAQPVPPDYDTRFLPHGKAE